MVTRAEGLREKRSTLRVVRAGALNSKRRLQNELNSKANSSTTNGSRELDSVKSGRPNQCLSVGLDTGERGPTAISWRCGMRSL